MESCPCRGGSPATRDALTRNQRADHYAQERRAHNARLLLVLDTSFEFRLPLLRLTFQASEEP